MSLMTRGATWLASRLKTAGGRTVTYRRANGDPVSLTATPKLLTYNVLSADGGLVTQVESWDWIITAADLGFDPIAGDQIEETINDVVKTYTTRTLGDKPCFEWADTAGILWVIHSELTEEEA